MTGCCAHILCGEGGAALLRAITEYMRGEGFVPTEDPSAAARTLLLYAVPGNPWITLAEEGVEAPFIRELRSDARKLVNATQCTLLATEVVDSDVSVALLCGPGAEDLCVRGEHPGMDCGPGAGRGKIDVWQELLGLSAERCEKLRRIWKADYDFEEWRLGEIVELLGVHPDILFPYQEDLPPQCRVQTLYFAAKDGRPKPFELVTEGETLVDLGSWDTYLIPGKAAMNCFFNAGGITQGAQFQLISEVFRDRDFEFSDAVIETKRPDAYDPHCWACDPEGSNLVKYSAPFEKVVRPDGIPVYVARFPDFIFPEGVRVDRDASPKMPWKKIEDAKFVRQIIVRYTMQCPPEAPEGTVAAVLLPLRGRALNAQTMRFSSQNRMDAHFAARRAGRKIIPFPGGKS